MHLTTAAAVFPLIFVGELPDKTMFASLVLSSRGRPLAVWIGAAAAFLVHVAIAVTVGTSLLTVLPRRGVDVLVAALFALGALLAFVVTEEAEEREVAEIVEAVHLRRVVATAFVVIFVAEWGDVTQVLTANLAARYNEPVAVAVGATLALWAVAGLAVVSGRGLLRLVPVRTLRVLTGLILSVLAVVVLVAALRR